MNYLELADFRKERLLPQHCLSCRHARYGDPVGETVPPGRPPLRGDRPRAGAGPTLYLAQVHPGMGVSPIPKPPNLPSFRPSYRHIYLFRWARESAKNNVDSIALQFAILLQGQKQRNGEQSNKKIGRKRVPSPDASEVVSDPDPIAWGSVPPRPTVSLSRSALGGRVSPRPPGAVYFALLI